MLINGMDRKSTALFDPTSVTKKQKTIAPISAPIKFMEPIHETSSFDSGPGSSRVDVGAESCGKAGETQPIMQPCDNETKFAVANFFDFIDFEKEKNLMKTLF